MDASSSGTLGFIFHSLKALKKDVLENLENLEVNDNRRGHHSPPENSASD